MTEKDLTDTTIKIKFSFDGIDYCASAKIERDDDIKYNYIKRAELIRSSIRNVDKPKTVAKIVEEVRKQEKMSHKLITKILAMFDGELWEHSEYRYPHGGRSARNYKVIKKKRKE